jgi:hypothetical protein
VATATTRERETMKKVRVFREDYGQNEHRWCVDIVLADCGHVSDECWTFDRWREAIDKAEQIIT